jgi:hypothetical protein
MRSNPLIAEALVGLARGGKAQLDYLGLLLLQAAVVVLWWPRGGVAQMLEFEHGPRTLAAVIMAVGLTMAYGALRAGTEEIMLPGQHGLRDWTLATPLRPGRILRGYILGQLVHSLYLLALSSPLVLMAFTVSGGEWTALGWCLAAVLTQALFYRLCGAIMHLVYAEHPGVSAWAARAILLLVYVPIGWLAPATSHLALTYRLLAEDVAAQTASVAPADPMAFLVIYAGLSAAAALAMHRLLARERDRSADPRDGIRVGEPLKG